MIDKLDETKAYKFIYLLNITVRDYMCHDKSNKETLAIYEDICILFLRWKSAAIVDYFKINNISMQLKHSGKLALIEYLQSGKNSGVIRDCIESKLIDPVKFAIFIDILIDRYSNEYSVHYNEAMADYYSKAKANFEKILAEL